MTPMLIGTKIGMTRIQDERGQVTPVTIVQAGPCTVTQIRTPECDGYHAVQVGFADVKPHRSTKPLIGHAAKSGTGPKRAYREIRLEGSSDVELGSVLTVAMFEESEVAYVDVAGTCKGKGFSGVVRRHGFGGQQATHGVERKHRSGGSIGGHSNIGLGRGIKKGKKMAGQWGNTRITQRNMKLRGIDQEQNLLLIEGSIPGPSGGLVCVRKSKTKG